MKTHGCHNSLRAHPSGYKGVLTATGKKGWHKRQIPEACLSPAVCYHVYHLHQDRWWNQAPLPQPSARCPSFSRCQTSAVVSYRRPSLCLDDHGMAVQVIQNHSVRLVDLFLYVSPDPRAAFKPVVVVDDDSANRHLVPDPVSDVLRGPIDINVDVTEPNSVLSDEGRRLVGKNALKNCRVRQVEPRQQCFDGLA